MKQQKGITSSIVRMCAESGKRCLSLHRLAHQASNASRMPGQASRPFPLDVQKVANGSQHVEQSCERTNICFAISDARTLVTASHDLQARDATDPQHQTHFFHSPILCFDHHNLLLLFFIGDCGSHFPQRIRGKEPRSCNNGSDDEFDHCEAEQKCFFGRACMFCSIAVRCSWVSVSQKNA